MERAAEAPRTSRANPAAGDRAGERGFSLLEVTVTLVLLLITLALFYDMILGAARSSMFAESRNDLSAIGQRVVNGIQKEINQSKLIFEENALGSGYRNLFVAGLSGGTAVWSNSRMPVIDQNTATLGADPGPNNIATRTGNSIILARQLSPVSVAYDHDADASTADVNFLADRYEFQYYFLRANPGRNFGNFGYYLDVVRASSEIFADYFQLSSVTTNRAQLIQRLLATTPITMSWDPGKSVGSAFYALDGSGSLTPATPDHFNVTATSLLPEFIGGRISGKMEYSVGLNSSTPIRIKDPIPLFATASSNFPGGLEFQVVGQSGFRKAITRLVLVSWYGGNYNSQEASVITNSHGF
jgi:prepilin-type N-terminal cleavage/methylation domain-containing protein